jgi:hypothetical protein
MPADHCRFINLKKNEKNNDVYLSDDPSALFTDEE